MNRNLPAATRETPRQLRTSSRNLSIFLTLGRRAVPFTLAGGGALCWACAAAAARHSRQFMCIVSTGKGTETVRVRVRVCVRVSVCVCVCVCVCVVERVCSSSGPRTALSSDTSTHSTASTEQPATSEQPLTIMTEGCMRPPAVLQSPLRSTGATGAADCWWC